MVYISQKVRSLKTIYTLEHCGTVKKSNVINIKEKYSIRNNYELILSSLFKSYCSN